MSKKELTKLKLSYINDKVWNKTRRDKLVLAVTISVIVDNLSD